MDRAFFCFLRDQLRGIFVLEIIDLTQIQIINFFEELKKRVDNGNTEEYIIDEQLKKCSNIERWQQYG